MTSMFNLRTLKAALGAAILGVASLAQSAVVLQATPGAASTAASTTTVSISATNDAANSAIGGFDLELLYDAALWTPTSVQFGQYLGDLANFEAYTDFDLSIPGLIRLISLSFIGQFDPLPLSAIQPAAGTAFSLVSVSFDAVGTGVGTFQLGNAAVTDAFGEAVNVVSEPSTFAAMGLGMLVLLAARRRKRQGRGSKALAISPVSA